MSLNELTHPANPITIITSTAFEQFTPYQTSATATIAAAGLLGGLLICTATGNISLTLPTATQMLAALPESHQRIGAGFSVLYTNPTAYAITLVGNTGFTITGLAVNPIVAATSHYLIAVCTSVTTPAFNLYG